MTPRLLLPLLLTATLTLALASSAHAAAAPVDLVDTTLTSAQTATGSCLTRQSAGTATTALSVPAAGYLYARLTAARGDWDVAIFNADGQRVSAGVTPGANEVASGYVLDGGTYTVQACRRSGSADQARLVADFTELPVDAKPEKVQLVTVSTPTRADKEQLMSLGMDMTEHGHGEGLGVVLHGERDAAKLRRAGFEWQVKVGDVARRTLRDRVADVRYAAATRRSALPSGRDVYRTLEDYNNEMRTLAEQNPGLVRVIELPHQTWEGRTVLGIEITTDVNVADGKPAFLNMGVHHAREWPSAEHAMEWAYELINGFKAGDARASRIVRESRNIIVPVVNPDGFNASRTAGAISGGDGGRDEAVPDTAYLVLGGGAGGEYRRKNCRLPNNAEAGNCATSVGLAEPGVDPNRNYGGLWGGPGADATNPLTQTYRGPGPFSEPETRNIKSLVGGNQVVTLITNHTTAGLVLRAPGIAALGDPVDEERGYKQLGDDMGLQNGYFSQKSFELYDTTGTTEDWTYNTAGGYGFTFEIYCGSPNYTTGDCDDPAFHPTFATMVKEWDGSSDQSNHVDDPGKSDTAPFGMQPGFDGGGNREAYYIAAESTLNEARHSIIEGEAPAGATLRIRKDFKTETFPQADGNPILFDDSLESVLQVGATGAFRWHTNPSTRPIVAKARGDEGGGEPAPPETQTGDPVSGPSEPATDDDGVAAPCGDANAPDPACWNDHLITVPATGDNRSANFRIVWTTPASDWDVKLFQDTNKDGKLDAGEPQIGTSENGATSEEEVGATGDPTLTAGDQYILRVTNFAAGEPYDVEITWNGPEPFQPAQVETWTLTCEVGGAVLQTTQVQVDRGATARPDLSECLGRARAATATPPVNAGGQPPATGSNPIACVSRAGFRSTKVTPVSSRRRVRLGFVRRATAPVNIDVFQTATKGGKVGERRVALFRNRARSLVWNGRSNTGRRIADGVYFVRFRTQGRGERDWRRHTLIRRNGRFFTRKTFYRPDSCGLLLSAKLYRPAFGGPTKAPLRVAFRLGGRATVTVVVRRGKKVVGRVTRRNVASGTTVRVRFRNSGRKLRRGVYNVRITAVGASRRAAATLVAEKL